MSSLFPITVDATLTGDMTVTSTPAIFSFSPVGMDYLSPAWQALVTLLVLTGTTSDDLLDRAQRLEEAKPALQGRPDPWASKLARLEAEQATLALLLASLLHAQDQV